jgi:hypothetical protein
MWMVEDALEGRLSIGQSRGSHAEEEYVVRLPGKQFHQLQKLLEEMAAAGGDFFRARIAVKLWEALRRGVVMRQASGPPPGEETDE